jgi:hypothetical protein
MSGSRRFSRLFLALLFIAPFAYPAVRSAQAAATADEGKPTADPVKPVSIDALWHDPGDVSSLDLIHGQGGTAHAPRQGTTYSFVKEDLGGTSTKFYVKDDEGVEWLVKVGDEARGETAATRFVWAMGYFTDEDYFVPRMQVSGMAKLHRHSKSIHKDGTITNARLKRSQKGQKKLANWAWADNPFRGSRELNGLRVMMALLNNWDLKTVNNKVYGSKQDRSKQDGETSASPDRPEKLGDGNDLARANNARPDIGVPYSSDLHYVVSDLGASFGRTGAFFSRSKGKVADYTKDKFIRATTPETVDFVMRTRPGKLIRLFQPGYTRQRLAMAATVEDIPRADAKWIGAQLARLTPEQIRAAFEASGFTEKEVDGYLAELKKRIVELNAL